ncbi:MAG: fluoride efflux transporter CrcB [Flavobacteriales bacterium]|nr:MAG: fluoride efflux transporter CrcB [Flavobacteriales bacterium]
MPDWIIYCHMNSLVAIFIGGGFGSLARYGVSAFSKSMFKTGFPLGTLLANALACLAMVFVLLYFRDKIEENNLIQPLIIMGFCGGFSTFSTFSYETVDLLKSGNHYYAIANIAISILLCIGILFILTKKQMV